MKVTETIKGLPTKVKRQLKNAMLLVCAIATFAVPAFGGGYSVLKEEHITSQAAAIEDVDLLLVAASAFGEARKVMNATDNDLKDIFVSNTSAIIGNKWPNMGLIIGARDSLSGSIWSNYQSPLTLSRSEVTTYGDSNLADAYNKYKAFGYAVQNLNSNAQKSQGSAVAVEEGLDAMSAAAIKLSSFGVKFLNDYNPGPVLIALYDSSYLATYSSNKLVQIVLNNDVLKNIITLFGDPVVTIGATNWSFFVVINAVLAIVGFALSLLLTLLGNRSIGDGLRKFIIRIFIGTCGIYLIGNFMSIVLGWVNETMLDVGQSDESRYVEENLNLYDWYLTGFKLPRDTNLQIDSKGNFIFTPDIVRSINEYTYGRIHGGGDDAAIKAQMESYTQSSNVGIASFIMPSYSSGEEGGEAWSTDVYYAVLKNYAENKEDLMDDGGNESSPLHDGGSFTLFKSRYFWMSDMRMDQNGDGWTASGYGGDNYYGLNPISAFNLIRSDFSGSGITATATVYPSIAYVAFDVNSLHSYSDSASTNMNALTRFIACFTLVLAALKGLITIFTAGFGGLISGGVKTAVGSSQGLGQALGAVIALLGGIIGISLIMSMTMSLLDTVYGIALEIVGDTEVLNSFLQPVQEAVGGIPVLGKVLVGICRSIAEAIMTLVLALTFPKLGGIPITVFAQYMADLPGHMAERAQMIESTLMSGRSSAGGGFGGPRGGSGQYGRMARQMAGNAFSSASRQTGAIVGAGMAAAGSLAGAGLSLAGKQLNKKADGLEGKPDNPGIKNWDDMSPEQQAKAAEAASSTDGWADMDEDARQAALKDAGVYDDNRADSGTPEHDPAMGSDIGSVEEAPVEESVAAAEDTLDAADSVVEEAPQDPAAGTVEENGAPIQEVGQESSMNQPAAQETEPAPAVSAEGGAPAETAPAAAPVIGTGGEGKTGGTVPSTGNGSGQTVNVKEGDHVEGSKQTVDTKVKQDARMDAKSVDASNTVNTTDAGKELGTAPTATTPTGELSGTTTGLGATGTAAGGITATAQQAQAAGKETVHSGSLPTGTSSSKTGRSAAQQSGANAHYTSVSQNTQAGGTATQTNTAQANSMTQVNMGADQSRSVSQAGSPTQAPGGQQSLDQEIDPQARKAAEAGSAGQSMNNGTAKSQYGKEMTAKEQRQARLLHAAGDGLQMMGGNRTLGQGIVDALGYAKDAALIAATLEELQQSGFMTNLRMKRMEKEQRRSRQDRK